MSLTFDPVRYDFVNATELGYQEDPDFQSQVFTRYIKTQNVLQNQILQDQFVFKLIVGTETASSSSNRPIRLRVNPINEPSNSVLLGAPPFFATINAIQGTWLLSDIVSNYAFFPLQNLDCSSGIAGGFVLDGTLIVNMDYCFIRAFLNPPPALLEVHLTENSNIIIEPGINCNMSYVDIQSCDGSAPWENIEVRNNATLTLDNSIISGSLNGITVLEGGNALIDNNEFNNNNRCIAILSGEASIIDNEFNSSPRGVYITGNNPNILDFEGNVFNQMSHIGVWVENTNNSVNLECPLSNRNIFDRCVNGIEIDNGAASIRRNKFIENIVGIRMNDCTIKSDIFFNDIGYTWSGIIGWDGYFDIYANSIGVTDGKGNHGVVTRGINMNSQVRENYIYAENNGIFSLFSSGVDIRENLDINSSASSGTNSIGIQMLISDNNVVDNYITVNDATAGIELVNCSTPTSGNEVAHNEITADSGNNTSGIKISGNSINQIINQNITEGQITYGILVENTTGNLLECNLLNASDQGLFISTGADVQTIQGNSFHAPVDYRTSSRTGIQDHTGNKFFGADINDLGDGTVLADGVDEAQFSRLLIDKDALLNPNNTDFSDFFPEIDPDGLRVDIGTNPGQTTYMCTGSPGPGGFTMPTDEFLCYLLSANSTYEQQFTHAKRINIYHWVYFYMSNVDPSNWPTCLLDYINNEACPGMISLSTSQVQLNALYQSQNTETNITSRREQMEQGLEQIRGDLNSISCLDDLLTRYRDVLVQLIEYAQSGVLSNDDITTLQKSAKLCPAEYGDAVHWARSLLSLEDDQRYDLEDTACRNLRAEGRESDRAEIVKEFTKLKVYPNPTNSEINISSDQYIGKLELYDQSGKILLVRNAKEDKAIKIKLDNYPSGLYWIKIINLNGLNEFKKISLIK